MNTGDLNDNGHDTDSPSQNGAMGAPPSMESEPLSGTEKASAIQRLTGIFTAPGQTILNIARHPDWIIPLIILIVATAVITQILVPAILADAKSSQRYQELMNNPDMSAEQLERIQQMQESGIRNFSAATAGVSVIITNVLMAAILLFFGNIVLAGEAKFLQLFSVVCWTGLIGTLGYVIRMFISLSNQTMKVYLGPAILMSAEAEETALFRFMAALDIFTLWRIALLVIGFAAIYKISTGKAATVIGGLYLGLIGATIILTNLF